VGRCDSGDADQVVEDDGDDDDEANDKSITTALFSSSRAGRSGITEDIGVAYALVGIPSSLSVDDMAGVEGGGSSNDCIENGRLCGSGIGELGIGDFGKSLSYQVPGIKAMGKIQVAVNVTPHPSSIQQKTR
jgi:hypothetical protein